MKPKYHIDCDTLELRLEQKILRRIILHILGFLLGTAFGYYWCWKALGGAIQ
jgi:hypothetical protein